MVEKDASHFFVLNSYDIFTFEGNEIGILQLSIKKFVQHFAPQYTIPTIFVNLKIYGVVLLVIKWWNK